MAAQRNNPGRRKRSVLESPGLVRDIPFAPRPGHPTGAIGRAGLILAEHQDYGSEGCALAAMSPPRGEWRMLGEWRNISDLIAYDEGWLVRGKPKDGRAGTWMIEPKGSKSLLVGGLDIQAFAILAGRLWYTSPYKDERGTESGWNETWVRSITLKQAAALGPAIGFVDSGFVNACGASIASMPLSSSRDLAEARRVLEERARSLGSALPGSAREADILISRLQYDADLDGKGFAALFVMLAGCLMDAGAEWVESPCPSAASIPSTARWESSDLATRSYLLSGTLSSALFDEEGWYEPASSIMPQAEDGRRVLIGLSAEKLRARAAELPVGDFGASMGKSAAEISAWFLT